MKLELRLVKKLNKYRAYLNVAFVVSSVSIVLNVFVVPRKFHILPFFYYFVLLICLWNIFIFLNWNENEKLLLKQMFITSNDYKKSKSDEFISSMMNYREQVYKIRFFIIIFLIFFPLFHLFLLIDAGIILKVLSLVITAANAVSIVNFLIKSDNDFDTMVLKYGDSETKKIVDKL
ncbi:hypothetical protein AB3K25_06490 [Leuconostoc sp. MS02]|uniref:Uncharacterized protein n=1 Tax=Leuconostoc aquikimchii TaxID=3236804 RepID=A0ABV3S1Z5_9LACO